jgi:hypothetical protein
VTRIVIADTEDDSRLVLKRGKSGFTKRVTQIAALTSDGQSFHSKGNVIEFLKWLNSLGSVDVWFHNLQYDLGNLFGFALDQLDVSMIGSRMIRARWRNVTFKDSLNIWPMSVKRIGKAFKLEKLKLDEHSKQYVFRDCEIMLKAMLHVQALMADYELEKIPSTLGGLCVRLWKAMGGSNWFDCDLSLSRAGFYGGRVERFRRTLEGDLKYCDINSLYPFVMTKPFPAEMLPTRSLDGYGLARVKLTVPKDFIAPLPVRREDASIYYPFGTLEGVWTFHEIRNAVEHGARIEKLIEAKGSQQAEHYYSDFVLEFYRLRKATKNPASDLFYKLLMNNLYGQLATTGEITRSLPVESAGFRAGVPYGGKFLTPCMTPLPDHTNYAHAAYVTSYGRLELQRYLREIEPGRLGYCDTDSIIFKGKCPFPISADLGAMKLERPGRRAAFYVPKTYKFDEDAKAKGVPKSLASEFIESGYAEFSQPFKFREAALFFDRANSKRLSVWRNVRKEFRSRYDRKRLDKGGNFWPKKHCQTD